MASQASNYLNSAVGTGSVPHSCTDPYGCGYGENIFTMSGFDTTTPPPCSMAVFTWYRESVHANYDYSKAFTDQSGTAGHFSQLVWKATTKVGCAVAGIPYEDGSDIIYWFVMCKYDVEGNLPEESVANVGALKSGAVVPGHPIDLGAPCVDVFDSMCPMLEKTYMRQECEVIEANPTGLRIYCPVTCGLC